MALPRMCYLDWWPPNDRNQSGLAPEGYAISRLFEPMLPHRIRAVGSLDRNDSAMAHYFPGWCEEECRPTYIRLIWIRSAGQRFTRPLKRSIEALLRLKLATDLKHDQF